MNQFLVLTSLVFWCFANTAILADETLYKTQVVEGVEYVFKTSPFGITVVRLQKKEENIGDRLVFPKRLGGRKVTALEGCRLPDEPRDATIGGMMRGDRRSLVNDKATIGFKHIVLPDSIRVIGDEAFHHCKDIVSVDLPDSVLDIGYSAFRGCTSLIEIKIPCHIEVIKVNTFENCSGLRKILLPESLQKIENRAFDGCCHLTVPTIPKGVKRSRYVFNDAAYEKDGVAYKVEERGDTKLFIRKAFILEPISSLTIPETLSGRRVVGICEVECSSNEFENISTIELPRSITEVNASFFHSFTNVEVISIPGVRKVWGCSGLKKLRAVNISNAQIIGYGAFRNCKSLRSVEIPENVKELPFRTFEGCIALEEVRLPKSLEQIRYYAFKGCLSLRSIEIPSALTSIESRAFEGCKMLESLTIPDGVSKLERDAFKDCVNLSAEAKARLREIGCDVP